MVVKFTTSKDRVGVIECFKEEVDRRMRQEVKGAGEGGNFTLR